MVLVRQSIPLQAPLRMSPMTKRLDTMMVLIEAALALHGDV